MRRSVRGNAVTLRHVKTITKANGRQYRYFAAPGRAMVRLPDLPIDDPAFLAAYAEAAAQARKAAPPSKYPTGSIGAGIAAYEASDAFLSLAKASRDARRRILYAIAKSYGMGAARDLAERHIEADLAKLKPHPANNRLKAWRGLCLWWKEAGLIARDPAVAVRPRKTAKTDGHEPWTAADVQRFRAYWAVGTAPRLAFEVMFWTAARVSDAMRLGPGMVDRQGWLVFRQGKTGGDVAVPFARALPAFARHMQADLDMLKAALDARTDKHMTWLTTEFGKARSEKGATQWFAAAARKAGLVNRTAHGLRKARAIALAEAGATAHQIMAWTGHASLSEAELYTRKADKRRILSGEIENDSGNAIEPTGNADEKYK